MSANQSSPAITGEEFVASLVEENHAAFQPDEHHYHELGRRLLVLYASSDNEQQVARQAARRTLEPAEEIQEMAGSSLG
jgi:hypothetical protein